MTLTQEILEILKKPFGLLIPDQQVSKEIIEYHISKSNKFIVSVGDTTTNKLLFFNIIPDIAIVDGKERRMTTSILKISEQITRMKKNEDIKNRTDNLSDKVFTDGLRLAEVHCVNTPGSISKNAVETIKDIIDKKMIAQIIVDGEEDLLALPIFCLSPIGTVVFYGQPSEGLVVVHVDEKIKKISEDLIEKIGVI